ncbi:MAG: DUF2804 domain-containing protein [Pseudomonadales bacterium]|nr:DUF2804 domain-containing protein [Pseudomonadales bacterium]
MVDWRITQVTPDSLINPDGTVNLGWWQTPFNALGLDDLQVPDPMGGVRARYTRFWRFKRWEFWCLDSAQSMVGLALVDLGYAWSVFAYVYDKATSQTRSWTERHSPWSRLRGAQMVMSEGAQHGRSYYQGRGGRIEIIHAPQGRQLRIDLPALELQGDMWIPAVTALSLCLPAGADGWTYTCKMVGMPVMGNLSVQGVSIEPAHALASLDISMGLMRRETYWQWTSLMGNIDGHIMGLNMAMGVNESGQTENALWLDGQLHKIGPASFHAFEGGCRMQAEGVNLEFQGRASHGEHVQLGWVASRFKQWQGSYSGVINIAKGKNLRFKGVYGLWEDHYVKW